MLLHIRIADGNRESRLLRACSRETHASNTRAGQMEDESQASLNTCEHKELYEEFIAKGQTTIHRSF